MGLGLGRMLTAYSSVTKKLRKTLDGFIDENSFVELDAFIGGRNELGEYRGEGVLCGFAAIEGVEVALIATNPAVFEGGVSKRGAEKIVRIIERATTSDVPVISVFDTAGARVLEGIDSLYGYAAVLKSYAKAYGTVPVFTVITGKNYGMLSYVSGFSDLCIAFDKAHMSTASPLIITAAAGDGKVHSDAKTLAASSGSITNTVKDTDELKALLTKALTLYGNGYSIEDDPNRASKTLTARTNPSIIINELFDQGSCLEIRKAYAPEVITALGALNGNTVGIVSVKGKLTSKGAVKITEFVNSISSFDIPLVNLVDCEGTVIDPCAEKSSLMRNVSDLIYALVNTDVPKLALITGDATGSAYSILAAKCVFDYVYAWDKSHIAPLESSSAANMLYGAKIAAAPDRTAAEKAFAKVYDDENSAFTAAEKGYVDNVIFPNHSRQYLIAALETLLKR